MRWLTPPPTQSGGLRGQPTSAAQSLIEPGKRQPQGWLCSCVVMRCCVGVCEGACEFEWLVACCLKALACRLTAWRGRLGGPSCGCASRCGCEGLSFCVGLWLYVVVCGCVNVDISLIGCWSLDGWWLQVSRRLRSTGCCLHVKSSSHPVLRQAQLFEGLRTVGQKHVETLAPNRVAALAPLSGYLSLCGCVWGHVCI